MMERSEERSADFFDSNIMLEARQKTWNALEQILHFIQPGQSEDEAKTFASSLMQEMGFEKQWHKINIRFGSNTTKSFRDNSDPGITLGEDDIFFVDIGPVWKGYEGDAGATRVCGNNERWNALAKDSKEIFDLASEVWKKDRLSGEDLFNFCEAEATKRGWRMIGRHMSGHRLSDFPHAAYHKGKLADANFSLRAYAWVLEIMLIDPASNRGAFYEDLLF